MQTSYAYSTQLKQFNHGQWISSDDYHIEYMIASVEIPFGSFVTFDTAAATKGYRKIGLTTTTSFMGIALRPHSALPVVGSDSTASTPQVLYSQDAYQIGSSVPVLTKGAVAMKIDVVNGVASYNLIKAYRVYATNTITVDDAAVASADEIGRVLDAPIAGSVCRILLQKADF